MPDDEAIGYYISSKNEDGNLAMHAETDDVGTYYIADDENLSDLKIRPVLFSEDLAVYGIELISHDFSLYFSNQVMDSESYYF